MKLDENNSNNSYISMEEASWIYTNAQPEIIMKFENYWVRDSYRPTVFHTGGVGNVNFNK